MTSPPLELTREQILAYRRRVGALDERLPSGADSLRRAAWAGLQDSMPRAAVLSIHARVGGATPSTWEDPSLVQVWGPRYSVYAVAERDRAIFTLGRLPDDDAGRRRAEQTADRLDRFLAGRSMTYGEAGRAMGIHPNALRYGAPTGRILIRWDGSRQPTVWTVERPDVDPGEARLELARRYVHVFGPTSADAFAEWAGIAPPLGRTAFQALAGELTRVRTPIGDAWILVGDEPVLAGAAGAAGSATHARLLPSGDTYALLQGSDRELLVPAADRRAALWPSRVWPGAVVLAGELVGTWRRTHATLTVEPWRRLSEAERIAVEEEAATLPLPDAERGIRVRWGEAQA